MHPDSSQGTHAGDECAHARRQAELLVSHRGSGGSVRTYLSQHLMGIIHAQVGRLADLLEAAPLDSTRARQLHGGRRRRRLGLGAGDVAALGHAIRRERAGHRLWGWWRLLLLGLHKENENHSKKTNL